MLLRNNGRCFNKQHDFIYRKTWLFSNTAVRTTNLPKQSCRRCSRCHHGLGQHPEPHVLVTIYALKRRIFYLTDIWLHDSLYNQESFLYSTNLAESRHAPRVAQLPVQLALGGLFPPAVTNPVCEADHSPLSSAELLKYLLRPKVIYVIGTSQYICYMLGTQTNISTWHHNNQISSQERSNFRIFSQNKFQCIGKTSKMTMSLCTYNSVQFFSHLWFFFSVMCTFESVRIWNGSVWNVRLHKHH